MPTMKKSIASISEDSMEHSSCSSPYCSLSKIRRSQSVSEVHEDVLNITPRLSQHYPKFHVGGRMQVQNCSSSNSMTSTEVSMPKSATELIEEIATLEVEVVHLERYLLSLYRTAFDQCIANSSNTTEASKSPSEWQSCNEIMKENRASSHSISYYDMNDNTDRCQNSKRTDVRRKINFENIEDTSSRLSITDEPKKDVNQSMSYHSKSLADHLGASIFDHVPQTASKLSEDIIKCICAIYSKLSVSQTQQTDIMPSPSSSPSSTLSAHDACDSWSSRHHYEGATTSPCSYYSPKNKQSSYSQSSYCGIVEIPRISVDGDKFGYASKMLDIFRSLIRKLEKINPDCMNHEEKLAFWINIHNALVMHAFLAYGLHQNHMKSTCSIMKAAYNVGGHTVNAHVIQSSILGCHLNRHALGLKSLLSPSKSLKKVKDKHPFALELSEPFAHFALSLGGYSDPAVRVYTAKNIYKELKLAKEEFIQATVRIETGNKIIIPKVLYYYAKDASLELTFLTKMVSESMPEILQKNIEGCLNHRKIEKRIEWSPYKSSFRYLVHRDLVKI